MNEYLLMAAASGGTSSGASKVAPLVADGRIFRTLDGTPWRWKGISGFKLPEVFRVGGAAACDPFLDAYRGFTVVRAWPYVEWGPDKSWSVTDPATINAFIVYCNRRGWYVEWTLLTSKDPARLAWAQSLVPQLRKPDGSLHDGLFLEGGNEPGYNGIDTPALRSVLEASGYLYASGDYEDSNRFYGRYGTTHTARTADWPRRGHDLKEFYDGEGPNDKTDPAHKNPWIGDEPAKLQDVAVVAADWRAYFGTCALLGAGATFHSETGKYAELPTADEQRMAQAALEGSDAFAADAPNGPYRRIDEVVDWSVPEDQRTLWTSRTYVVGNCMVRCQPKRLEAYEPGWTPIDSDGVLWRR